MGGLELANASAQMRALKWVLANAWPLSSLALHWTDEACPVGASSTLPLEPELSRVRAIIRIFEQCHTRRPGGGTMTI